MLVKVGGSLARDPAALARAATAVAAAARRRPIVVVPGGGPFADQVRAFDREVRPSASAAHWMATLAMDQYAYALADAIPGAVVVHDGAGVRAALAGRRIPVLAPARWLLAADPLPHGWDVTSDSIAAFLAGALDASLLVLLKPASGPVEALADPRFPEALPAGLPVEVLGPDEFHRLESVAAGLRRVSSPAGPPGGVGG